MRKVYLEDLPKKKGFGVNKDKETVDWEISIGLTMRFEYDGINGMLKIVNYYKEKSRVGIEYNNNVVELKTDALKHAKLAKLVGSRNGNHIYNNGEIINNFKIIECIRVKRKDRNSSEKGYIVECCKDGNVCEVSEYSLKRGNGCPVCAGVKLMVGVNDVGTINNEIKKYLLNKNDADTYTYGSNKKVDFKCPDCGYIKNMAISNFLNRGFVCNVCGDKGGYPNRFMCTILHMIGVEFKTEYSPKWLDNRRFDFYIPSKKLVIEMDGGIGHGKGRHKGSSYRDLNESKEIDMWKDAQANKHGINVIRIDCDYKSADRFKYIHENILNSRINEYIDISSVNFAECDIKCMENKVKQACEMWKSGKYETTTEVGNSLNLSGDTIRKYLKRGSKLGWCSYNPKQELLKSLRKNGSKSKELTLENLSPTTHKICDLWNNGVKSSSEIGNIIEMSSRNVLIHLKRGAMFGLCDYSVGKAREFSSKNNSIL